MFQQQMQKSQNQQGSINCTDIYCNCNQSSLNSPNMKLNTINSLISHNQQEPLHQTLMSNNTLTNTKLSKSPSGKVTKQRRSEERANERRISNLINLSKAQLTPQNKKNISKLLQTSNVTNNLTVVKNDKDHTIKKGKIYLSNEFKGVTKTCVTKLRRTRK